MARKFGQTGVVETIPRDKAVKLIQREFKEGRTPSWHADAATSIWTLVQYRGDMRSLEYFVATDTWRLEVRLAKRS